MSSLTLAQGSTIVDETLKHGRKLNMKPLAVSVLDSGGHLVAFKREDTAATMRFQISSGKANACLAMGFGGREMYKRSQTMPVFMSGLQAASNGRFFPMIGGVLIRNPAGEVVGAVGVSGDTSENDEAAALIGIAAAGLKGDAGEA